MPEFTQALANSLLGIPWSTKIVSGPGFDRRDTCFFFKYHSDDVENICYFMITDTIHVWAEVLDSKHTSHRARRAHSARSSTTKRGFLLPYHDVDDEAEWRTNVVRTLGEVHRSPMQGRIEVEVKESVAADLSVFVSDPSKDFHWLWDVMSVGNMAGEILSKQLIMPLATLATIALDLGQPASDVSEESLRVATERKASTAKVMPAQHLRGLFDRESVQTVMKGVAQVAVAPSFTTVYESQGAQLTFTPSIDMMDATGPAGHETRSETRHPASSPDGSAGRSGTPRKGKGRDDTDEEDDGSARKMPRGAAPGRFLQPTGVNETSTSNRESGSVPQPAFVAKNPQSKAMDSGNTMASPRRPPHTPAPPRPIRSNSSDIFDPHETQTQEESDDESQAEDLKRRVRAAGAIGTIAVRTPALGAKMQRRRI